MDQLLTSIAGTCPAQFSGPGVLFLHTIAALVTTHCGILNDPEHSWPDDRTDEVLRDNDKIDFDFVVVGAGTAGSLLASRLIDDFPSFKILLIEAGGDPGIESEIPAFCLNTDNLNWGYKVQPDLQSCMGCVNNTCFWNKGKALGGSSAINAMIYVRGHPNDFENWKKMGCDGWGYSDVLPYFEKNEKIFHIPDKNLDNDHEKPLYVLLSKAYEELGYSYRGTDVKDAKVGASLNRQMIKNGKRYNTAKVCLSKAAKNKNFYLMKHTQVQKLVIDQNTKTAVGVEIKTSKGISVTIRVRKEVILSAGSIATPQILMLSGIGPKQHLQKMGIDTMEDLPVGQNLQDHAILPLYFQIGAEYSFSITQEENMQAIVKYMISNTGPLAKVGILDFLSFVDTTKENFPDIEFHHSYFYKNDPIFIEYAAKGLRYNEYMLNALSKINENHNIIAFLPYLLHPKSMGNIQLQDTNQETNPIIVSNYFKEKEDIEVFIRSIRIAQKMEKTETFKKLGIKLAKLDFGKCDHEVYDSDLYWECYIRHKATTVFHPVGTAKMGADGDKSAVVNEKLQVHGVRNLRVVDASIMPSIVSGNTMAATLMIGQKAADFIQQDYRNKDEL